jgi:coproporphyrinogen III oxidase-like Fe-S oxidoreductase
MNLNVIKTCRFCGFNKITKANSLSKQYLQGYLQTVIIIKKKIYPAFVKKFLFC